MEAKTRPLPFTSLLEAASDLATDPPSCEAVNVSVHGLRLWQQVAWLDLYGNANYVLCERTDMSAFILIATGLCPFSGCSRLSGVLAM